MPRDADSREMSSAPRADACWQVMFALAGLWAGAVPLLARMPPPWHAHELLYGMLGAAAAGYHLTAAPRWSGLPPPSGRALAALALLWLAARAAAAAAPALPPAMTAAAALAFPLALAAMMARRVWAGRAWARAGYPPAMLVWAGAGALLLAGPDPRRTALAIVLGLAVLFARIGARVVPAFTATALAAQGAGGPAPRAGALSRGLAPAFIALALIGTLAVPGARWPGALLALAGAALVAAQIGWRPGAARRDGLLAMLHLAHFWLGAGCLLLGRALALPESGPPTTALHALTMGAMGGTAFAFGARAAAPANGRGRLIARRTHVAGFACIMAATLLRLGPAQGAAAGLWAAGWALFLIGLLAAVRAPRRGPVFSGRRG